MTGYPRCPFLALLFMYSACNPLPHN
ncbi:hypothetical protein CCACVL1_12379 [Corchorus capsularis]|uniref:Uncharacterized protein n=1 Tax=Corchorus capsularis TaxID=210143 RepID=A0A1R3IG25_COCAP|nr:hypothetical protein CCACVL1_12379 [Corchorus capsularis]